MRRTFFTLILLATFSPSIGHCATLHVSKAGDGSDGTTWETAFLAISDAVMPATAGDEIWVASGTYNESLSILKSVKLFGGFSGDESSSQITNRNLLEYEGEGY